MTTKTYAELGTLASVNDGDLIAGFRASGPLKTYTADIVRTYMIAAALPVAGGTMTGALKLATGAEGTPSLSFGAEATTGLYRSGAGNADFSILGVRRLGITATGINVYGTCTAQAFSGPLTGNVTGNLTGNVTGNVTGTVTGNASTATKWATARDLSLTGDVTATLASVDGSAAVSGAATLATTQSAVHTWSALQTYSAGADMTPAATPSTTAVGYLGTPTNSQAGDYTLVMSDAGKTVRYTGSGNTFTIPANASVAYPVGTVIPVVNEGSGSLTVAITSDTLKWLAAGTGSRTLAVGGTAALRKDTATSWRITGDLLS